MYENNERVKGRDFFTNTSWHGHDSSRSLAFMDNRHGFHDKPQDLLLFNNFGKSKIVALEDFLGCADNNSKVKLYDDGMLTVDTMSINEWSAIFEALPGEFSIHERFIAPYDNLNLCASQDYLLADKFHHIFAPLHLPRSVYFNYKDSVYLYKNPSAFSEGGIVGYGLIASNEYTAPNYDYTKYITYVNLYVRGFDYDFRECFISTSELKELFPKFNWDKVSNLKKLPARIVKKLDEILVERRGNQLL